MKGRAVLFSAFKTTLLLAREAAGAKAEADPARTARATAAILTIFSTMFELKV
jgi:hypothetical protein